MRMAREVAPPATPIITRADHEEARRLIGEELHHTVNPEDVKELVEELSRTFVPNKPLLSTDIDPTFVEDESPF